MAHCQNCGCNKISCGCKDTYLTTPPPCPTPVDCPEAQPCSEVFPAECIIYTGPNILCNQDIVVTTNDSVSDALVSIVDKFCAQDSYIENVELQDTTLVFTGLGLAFDGSIDLSSIIPSIEADNGLTVSVGGVIQLGGTLIQDTTINTANFDFNLIGDRSTSSDSILFVQNTGQGGAISATNSTFNTAAIATKNVGLLANGVAIGLLLTTETTSALPASGIANKIQFSLSHNNSGNNTLANSNEIISTFTDVLSASLTSELLFKGKSGGGVMSDLVTFKGDGEVQFHEYGVGNFINTPTYMLGVDASGNVVEVAL